LELKNYVGTYSNSFYCEVEIRLLKGKMTLHFSHHPNNIGKLEYLGNDQFLCTYSDLTCGVQVLPIKMENNQIKGITVKVADFIDYLSYDFEKVR
jgi:hypothetical protein